jgi:hypothetical protein
MDLRSGGEAAGSEEMGATVEEKGGRWVGEWQGRRQEGKGRGEAVE